MTNLIWSIVLAGVGILGIYLAGNKSLWGWAVSFAAQALWFTFAIVTGQYGFILSSIAYGLVYGRNFLRWRAEQPKIQVRVSKPIDPMVARSAWLQKLGRLS